MNNDTISLLQECSAGANMAMSAIDQVLEGVENPALRDALTADGNVRRVKGYIRAADGVRFVSDTGQGFETMESRDAPVPLMIICMQGTAGAVRAALHEAGIA